MYLSLCQKFYLYKHTYLQLEQDYNLKRQNVVWCEIKDISILYYKDKAQPFHCIR